MTVPEQWEPRKTPDVDPETALFWRAAADGTLLLYECDDCGLVFYYPRAFCPDDLSPNVSPKPAAGTGRVYTYATTDVVSEWPSDDLPMVSAIVELDEGPRMLTTLVDCEADSIAIGDRVEVLFIPTDDEDVAIPVFRPTD